MLAGLILRVSYESARRDEYDRRRESFAVMDESTAGVAMCAVNDLRVAALPFWMVLHPSR